MDFQAVGSGCPCWLTSPTKMWLMAMTVWVPLVFGLAELGGGGVMHADGSDLQVALTFPAEPP